MGWAPWPLPAGSSGAIELVDRKNVAVQFHNYGWSFDSDAAGNAEDG